MAGVSMRLSEELLASVERHGVVEAVDYDRANARLAKRLKGLGGQVKEPRRTNIKLAAQSMAASAHAKGERFHAGNATIYPKKHYPKLEKMFGVMSAPELVLFDDAYEAYMAWHSEISEDLDWEEEADLDEEFEGYLPDAAGLSEALATALTEKAARVGEKRERKDGTWVKVAPRRWVKEKTWREGASQLDQSALEKAKRAQSSGAAAKEMSEQPVPTGRQWIPHAPGLPEQTIHEQRVSGHGADAVYKPERQKLHNTIIDAFLKEAKPVPPDQKPVALFMMGIPASGKSSARNKVSIDPFDQLGAVPVDPDACKEALPEYQDAVANSAKDAAWMAHEESSDIAEKVGAEAVRQRKNVIFDGTGKNLEKMKAKIAEAKAAGYHVMAIMPHVTLDEAKRRAGDRAEKVGRFVPHEIIEGAFKKVPGNFLKLADDFDEFSLFDNNGGGPRLMMSKKAGGQSKVEDEELFRQFQSFAEWVALTNAGYAVTFWSGGYSMTERKGAPNGAGGGGPGKKPVTDMNTLEKWFKETDAAERKKSAKMPKKFKKGEGISTPLPD